MLDPRLKFLRREAKEGEAELSRLEGTDQFALEVEGVEAPRVRVLMKISEAHTGDDSLTKHLEEVGVTVYTRAGDIISGDVEIRRLAELDKTKEIEYIEASRPMQPELDASLPEINVDHVHSGPQSFRGEGVIVGTIDSGIDWRHRCFRDPTGKSIILRIWDQRLSPNAGETSSAKGYGVEYQGSDIDKALSSRNPLEIVRHVDHKSGHGTHVAGIAVGTGSPAGNGKPEFTYIGVAPEADLVVVANAIETKGIGDSVNTLDAVGYIFDVAEELDRPVVINISQGDNLGPHDGTSLLERGIDNLLRPQPSGRAIVKSAGNAANVGAHAKGQLKQGDDDVVEFLVPSNDLTPDTIDIWYSGDDRILLRITPPNGAPSAEVQPGTVTTLYLPGGNEAFVDSVVRDRQNNENRIYVQLLTGSQRAIQPGKWSLTLAGQTVDNSGIWHAWIERGNVVPQFIGVHRDDGTTISIPGTAQEVITAAAYITKGAGKGDLANFSSRGPTRDGRPAPTLAAPGQAITAPLVEAAGINQYQSMSGTSMAAPHLTGICALIFEAHPDMTQGDLVKILRNSARKDDFTGDVADNRWGAGKLDGGAAITAADSPF
ncbi:S8 family peptidase [Streptomyces sp. NPDC056891]|uniref:S8 family peptidase n=1 Tax=Streptomyces sp. NPDC056891 TaxID=3345961 RepID=UPI00369256CB